MKLNRIKKLCRDSCRVDLYTRRDGRQFISDGVGIWPVDEQIYLTEGSIRTIFDVPLEKWEGDWSYQGFDYGADADAEASGIPESLLDDIGDPGETKFLPRDQRIITPWGELMLFRELDGERHLWAPTAQLIACPDRVSYFALRETPGGVRALAVYENMLMGALIMAPGRSMQTEIQEMLRGLSEREVM